MHANITHANIIDLVTIWVEPQQADHGAARAMQRRVAMRHQVLQWPIGVFIDDCFGTTRCPRCLFAATEAIDDGDQQLVFGVGTE